MEQQEILEKLPQLHAVLIEKNLSDYEWTQLHTDLTDLVWLNSDDCKEQEVIKGIIKICDRFGKATLENLLYFKTFELNRVLVFINDSLYEIVTQKEKVKEICSTSKRLINEMDFFKASNRLIQSAKNSNLVEIACLVHDSYKVFKRNLVNITLQLEKSIQNEYDKSFGDLLDDVFYTEALYPSKAILQTNSQTEGILDDYKTKRYTTNHGYTTSYFTSYNKNENIYIGEANDYNMKHGYGKMYYSCRDLYEGMWENDKQHGKGLYLWKEGSKYLGDFAKGQMHGFGKKYYCIGDLYEGEFSHGKRSGKGIMKFKNGDVYDGEWNDEDMHGHGMYSWASGDSYVGEFKRDKRDGKGILTLNSGEVYEATWKNGTMEKDTDN